MMEEHLDIEDVGQMAARAHVKSVLAKFFSGPVFGSADLQRYCLSAAPAGGQSNRTSLRLCA